MKQAADSKRGARRKISGKSKVDIIGFGDATGGTRNSPSSRAELIGLASDARNRQDWPAALAAWQAVSERFPEESTACIGGAQALRALGRMDEAAVVLRDATERFPQHGMILHDLGRVAEAQGEWTEAEGAWRRFVTLEPNTGWGYVGLAHALNQQSRLAEAEEVLLAAQERLPDEPTIAAAVARMFTSRGNWPAAEQAWRRFLTVNAREWWAHTSLAHVLNRQERSAEAEAVLEVAQGLLPQEVALFADHARMAETRRDWTEALARWERVRARFPGEAAGLAGCIAALRALGRLIEAEPLLREAAERTPEQPAVQQGLALVAEELGNWPEAELRWTKLRSIDGSHWSVHTGLARALVRQERVAEAEALLMAAQKLLPHEVAVFADYAQLADDGQRWLEAAERWEVVRDRWPDFVRGYLGMGLALARAGRFDEADKVIETAMERFPSVHDPVAVFAEIAVFRHDWPQAVLRWTHARMLFPELEGFSHRLFEARQFLFAANPDDDRAHAEAVPTVPHERRDMYDVMMCFESLGNGCEFGTVQRTYGAEPLGLLRWAAIAPQHLVAAFDSNFSGVGTTEQTELFVHRTEYIVRDKKFDMGMHTFLTEDKISMEKMFEQSCRRLEYLSKKLMTDIQTAEKIFVYLYPYLEASEISALHTAFRRHGPATLFVVQVATEGHLAGTVEVVEPGLMMGYISNVGFGGGSGAYTTQIEQWGAICRTALEQMKRQELEGSPATVE